jgi:iron complex outermembrane receptor protein
VLKGGNISHYGSGAFAGALNIILKTSQKLHLELSGGEKSLYSFNISTGGSKNKFSYRASIQRDKTDGFYKGRELSGLNLNSSLKFSGDNMSIDLFAGFAFKEFGAEGFYASFPSWEKTKVGFLQLLMRRNFNKMDLTVKAALQNHRDNFVLDRNRPDFYTNDSSTRTGLINFSAGLDLENLFLTAGLELKSQKLDSSAMNIHYRNFTSFFFSGSLKPFRRLFSLDINGRIDYLHSVPYFTFYSGFSLSITSQLNLKAGIGKTVRYPSFTELFYKSPANIGNPLLKPEQSLSLETSLAFTTNHHSFEFSLFARQHKDLIDWIRFSNLMPWIADNITKNNIFGFEISHTISFKKIYFSTGFERIYSDKTKLPFQSKYGLRFPNIILKLNTNFRIDNKNAITALYTFKKILNSDQKGHFLNLSFSRRFSKKIKLVLKIDNLFNTRIEELPDLLTTGRWAYISLLYN